MLLVALVLLGMEVDDEADDEVVVLDVAINDTIVYVIK